MRLSQELYTFHEEQDWENSDDDFDAYEEKHYFTYAILWNTLKELWAVGTIQYTDRCSNYKYHAEKQGGLSV